MQCEICGQETGKLKTVMLDGTEMKACENCAKFGIEKEKPLEHARKIEFERQERIESNDFESESGLKPSFGRIIQGARQRKNLTFEELGKKIFESPSVLKRVESEKMVPEPKLIKKLEKELELKLTE